MDSDEHHRLAMLGSAALEKALREEALVMAAHTVEHVSWHTEVQRLHLLKGRRRKLAPDIGANPLPIPSKILCSWVQYTGAKRTIVDVDAGDWEQHIDVVPNEVLLLPFKVAKILLGLAGGFWSPQTVIPDAMASTHDAVTGLDMVFVYGSDVWGNSPGETYFDADFGAGPGERMRLLVIGGIPYLSNDY